MTAIEDAREASNDIRASLTQPGEYAEEAWAHDALDKIDALITEHERLTAHDSQCEAEYILEAGGLTDCECRGRLTASPTDDEREALAQIVRVRLDRYNMADFMEGPMHLPRGIADEALSAGFRRQGPITDEQVQAARDSLYRQGNRYPSMEDMRAALEAAEATR